MKYATELISSKTYGRVMVRKAADSEKSGRRDIKCRVYTQVFDTIEEARAYAKKTQALLQGRIDMRGCEGG
jgi:hypothetical protein